MTGRERLRRDVHDVLRYAIELQAEGDLDEVRSMLRRRLVGRTKQERLDFTAVLAWTAAELAGFAIADDGRRERFLEQLLWTDQQLLDRLAEARHEDANR